MKWSKTQPNLESDKLIRDNQDQKKKDLNKRFIF